MQKNTKHIRAGLFGLIVLTFLLPFIIISCPNHGSVSVTGLDLTTGKTIKGSHFSEITSDQRIKPEPFAILALLCAVSGIVFSYIKKRKTAFFFCAAASLSGIIFLLLLKNSIYLQTRRLNYNEDLVFRYAKGYYLALIGFTITLTVTLILSPIKKLSFPIKLPGKKRARRTTTAKKTSNKTRKKRR